METWELLLGAAAVMVLYLVVATVVGQQTSVPGMVLAVVFGLAGWVAGQRLTERFG